MSTTRAPRGKLALIAALSAAVLAAGCGGSTDSTVEPATEPVSAPDRPTAEQVIDQLGLVRDESGLSYTHSATGCYVQDVLEGRGTVELYAEAGDVVASTADREIGVVTSSSDDCHRKMTEALAGLEQDR